MRASLHISPPGVAKRPLGLSCYLAVVVLGALSGGCASLDEERRQRILSFFFTGVPSLQKQNEEANTPDLPNVLLAQDNRVKEERRREVLRARTTEYWTHGPVGANRCSRCHAVRAAEGLRSAGLSMAPMQLTAPVEELCVSCHEHQGVAMAAARGLQVHAPVGAGRCDICHDAHSAPRRYQLKGESDRDLCMQCHAVATLVGHGSHESAQPECTACHNAHLGRTRWLLRSDFDEAVDNYTQ